MSATGQAAAGGDGGQAQGGEGAAQGFDAAALQQQLSQTAGGVDELRSQFSQFLESAPWQQPEAEPEPQGLDPDLAQFLDDGMYGDPAVGEAERAQRAQAIQEAMRREAQQAISPLQQQLAEQQRELAIRDLVQAHPEFQDPEIANRIAGPNGLAAQAAQEMGRPDLAGDPVFWKIVYMADRGAQTANAEAGQDGADAPNAALLEGGGGAGPAGGQQVDLAGQIIGSRKGSSVLPF